MIQASGFCGYLCDFERLKSWGDNLRDGEVGEIRHLDLTACVNINDVERFDVTAAVFL